MPANMEASAAKAIKRHDKRLLSPGVAVDVEKVSEFGYRLVAPHSDTEAWRAMICNALGTRSRATADTFLFQLAELCSQNWHPLDDGGGEWCPDERDLNMILNFVAGVRPKNELEAALAAEMVAVHLMTMKLSAKALTGQITAQDAAVASKLAKTFATQIDTLSRLQGRRPSTKQTITVRQQKHVHLHQHVHVTGGGSEIGSQAFEPSVDRDSGENNSGAPRVEHERCPALPGKDATGVVVPMSSDEGQEPVSNTRRGKGLGSAKR